MLWVPPLMSGTDLVNNNTMNAADWIFTRKNHSCSAWMTHELPMLLLGWISLYYVLIRQHLASQMVGGGPRLQVNEGGETGYKCGCVLNSMSPFHNSRQETL